MGAPIELTERSNEQTLTNLPPAAVDLDGTLIAGHFRKLLAALRALGHDPGEALDIKHAIGPRLEDLLQALLQAPGDDRIGEAVAAYRHHYAESGLLGSVPYPGISGALQGTRISRGYHPRANQRKYAETTEHAAKMVADCALYDVLP